MDSGLEEIVSSLKQGHTISFTRDLAINMTRVSLSEEDGKEVSQVVPTDHLTVGYVKGLISFMETKL